MKMNLIKYKHWACFWIHPNEQNECIRYSKEQIEMATTRTRHCAKIKEENKATMNKSKGQLFSLSQADELHERIQLGG